MQLNLKQLVTSTAYEERTFDFDQNLDLSAVKLWGGHPFSKSVAVSGTVVCRSGIFTIDYTAVFEMHSECSRCLTPVNRGYNRSFTHTILIEPGDEEATDEFIPAPNGELDLDGLVISDLLLTFGGVMLCSENCCGLCPKCGKNLNDGDCGCILHEPDPRFQALRDLLNEKV